MSPIPRIQTLVALLACLIFAPANFAANAGVGTVEGRVFNPMTGEYIRNAEVRIQGTTLMTVTEADGRFRLPQVPAGEVTLSVNYTAYRPASATVVVPAGGVVTRNFDLQSTLAGENNSVVALDSFTVSSRREGTAKAIMDQRAATTVKNVIASDTFGDMIEGNLAEVVQYLPGLEVVYCGGDPVSFSGRGMAAKYSSLSIDGVRTNSPSGVRQPAFTRFSANAADMIEFSKTNSADMDADAPGGSLNLKSKSAFQRKGRQFTYQLFGMVNSYQLHLGKTIGPNDGKMYKTGPGLILDYSDIYLDGKLGVVINLSETNGSNDQSGVGFTYNTTPTAASPEPVMITTTSFGNGPKHNRRQAGGLNLEYKLTPRITLALRGQVNWEDARFYQHTVDLVSGRANQAPGSNALRIIANPTTTNATRIAISGNPNERTGENHSFAPSITYQGERLLFDATFSYSRGSTVYRQSRMDSNSVAVGANMQLYGIGFTLERDSVDSYKIRFQQTSGPDVYDLSNWRATTLLNNIIRSNTEPIVHNYLGQFNARYTPNWKVPTYLKVGGKSVKNEFTQTARHYSWTYVGPGGDRLTADVPVSVYRMVDWTGSNLFSDRKFEFPDRQALGSLLRDHPEYFVRNPADSTHANNLYPYREAREYIDAAYVMANTRLGRTTLQGGVRFEQTETRALVYERGVPEMRTGEYKNFFFSGAAKYRFTDSLMALASFSQSILRPDLNTKTAVATINDETMTGTLPNPDLKPEYGDNYSVRLEYYFEPVGVLSAGVFMMDLKDYHTSGSRIPAEELGLGSEYPGYEFSTQRNAPGFKMEGYELEYSQQLSFLPGVLRGLGVFANYSHTFNSDPTLAYDISPETMSAGVSFRYRGFNGALRWSATPDVIRNANNYREARDMLGLSLSYQLTQRTSLFVTGRNITDAPINYWRINQPGYLERTRRYGSNWTFGVKGTF